MAMEWKQNY